jgi:hypothetical protein
MENSYTLYYLTLDPMFKTEFRIWHWTRYGYDFMLSPGLYLGTDIMASIPPSDTFNAPGLSNSIFNLKLGLL